MPVAKLLTLKEEEVFVHDSQRDLEYRSIDHDYMDRVVDGPEIVERMGIITERIPIRRHAWQSFGGLKCERYIAMSHNVEKIVGVELKRMNSLEEHADNMQHASVIDKCSLKNIQAEFDKVLYAPWYRRLVWAFTGEIA